MRINASSRAKRMLFAIVRIRTVNVLLRWLLRPFSPLLLDSLICRIPVVGHIHVTLPDSRQLILASDGDDAIASALYWAGPRAYEPETIDLYWRLLKHSQVVFDVGAHTGLFALLAAIENGDRDVHAFEPVPRIFNYLKRNAEVNGLRNLKAVCNAVTNFDGDAVLYIPRSITFPFSASTRQEFRKAGRTIVVPAVRIDTYVAANHIARVDLLKIDTESTEAQVLEGAKQTIERDQPLIICEVLVGLTEESLQAVFVNTDHKSFLITDGGLVPKEAIAGDKAYKNRNYLFIPESKMPRFLHEISIRDER